MKWIVAVCFFSICYLSAKSQNLVKVQSAPLDTNAIVYDEHGKALRYYQYTKLLNTGEYEITSDGQPGTAGVKRYLKKIGVQKNLSLYKLIAAQMAIKSPMLQKDSVLDIKPLMSVTRKKELDQKVIVLVFWDAGCPPCTDSFSSINDFFDQLPNRDDVVMIAITPDDESVATGKLKEKPLKHAYMETDARETINTYQLTSFPAYVVTDKNHVIRYATSGSTAMTMTMLKNSITQALQ
jgi:peroxiredoxin